MPPGFNHINTISLSEVIAEAYILFLAFHDKLLSEGHYYVFLKEEQRTPSQCFTTLSWGGETGNGLFQGFPRAFLGLEQASSPHTGMTQRDGIGSEVGGWFRMGNTCKSMADSCQCMAKNTTIL